MDNIAYKIYAEKRLRGKLGISSSFFFVWPFLKNKKVLDIGCSDGLYLKFFGPESAGIEQIKELAMKARQEGLNVFHAEIQETLAVIPSESFSAVLFSHVLEHLESPICSLREIKRILEPNGLLVIALPTENNIIRIIFRMDYFDGTHLYSFSVKNIQKLLKLTGFMPMKVFYDLPKCKGLLGRLILKAYQHFPLKELISMAYWIVAKRV